MEIPEEEYFDTLKDTYDKGFHRGGLLFFLIGIGAFMILDKLFSNFMPIWYLLGFIMGLCAYEPLFKNGRKNNNRNRK